MRSIGSPVPGTAGSSGYVLREYATHAVRDNIVDEMNVRLGWDTDLRIYPILDAILECGGFTKYAKESSVLILRKSDDKNSRIKINIDDLVSDGDLGQNIELARGDYVIVQEGIF